MACFLRELVILNECEGSQNRVKERCFALLSMTNNIGVNCYIVAYFFSASSMFLRGSFLASVMMLYTYSVIHACE